MGNKLRLEGRGCMWKRAVIASVCAVAGMALAQTIQVPSPKQGRPGDRLPWTRFYPRTDPYKPTAEEKQKIQAKIDELGAMIRELRARKVDDALLPDVEIFYEAARWKMEFPREFFRQKTVAMTLNVLDKGIERAAQLKQGKSPWTTQKGQVLRGYRSAIDGSVQPLRVTIPEEYDGTRAFPLDVAQHGRFVSLYEVEFLSSWDGAEVPYLPGTIQIDLNGRGKNTYHWPGETDVFEAIAFTRKAYKVDTDRMSLRGFSMGGAGVWHFGLHFPDLWAAVEVGSGDNESHRMPVLGDLAPHQQAMCHIFDNMYEWALNAFDTNFIGFVGELDGGLRKHIAARLQLAREGLHFEGESFTTGVHLVENPAVMFFVASNTPHEYRDDFRKRMDEIDLANLKRGRQVPDHIRFVTYTTRYNHCYWLTLDGLEQHYDRAEINAKRSEDHTRFDVTTKNLTRLLVREADRGGVVNIDGQQLNITGAPEIALEKTGGTWHQAAVQEGPGLRKRHGLQGPIDDAFMDAFLVVRPTGTPWNAAANRQALAILDRFDQRYRVAYRGHMRIKDDKDVTESDFQNCNVVLFGDPGSNRWIARLNGKLPVAWTRDAVTLGAHTFPAAESLPAYIYPDPLSPSHYVVINSGLTANWVDWAGDFPTPEYGDFAVLRVSDKEDPDVAYAGLFDERWQLP